MAGREKRKYKIMVVDDAGYIRVLFRESLTRAGYEIVLAESGMKALQLMGVENPDLVLLDINMPDMTGLEMLENLRMHNQYLPVIIVSASGYKDKVLEAVSHGISGYLTKPVDLEELKSRVAALLDE